MSLLGIPACVLQSQRMAIELVRPLSRTLGYVSEMSSRGDAQDVYVVRLYSQKYPSMHYLEWIYYLKEHKFFIVYGYNIQMLGEEKDSNSKCLYSKELLANESFDYSPLYYSVLTTLRELLNT